MAHDQLQLPARRLLWIVNHKALMPAEVPILRSLGWGVFVPKLIPDHDPGYRSAAITYEYDESLGLPSSTMAVLNAHNFYERAWSPTLVGLINDHFDTLVAHFSYYTTTLSEAARKFEGRVIARAFGREAPKNYAEFAEIGKHKNLLAELEGLGERFTFGQSYDNISEIEPDILRRRAHTITVPLPPDIFTHRESWHGRGATAAFLCPAVTDGGYYCYIYQRIKRDFGSLPHVIFGRQMGPVNDPALLPYLTDRELIDLYASTPVFVYPHTEVRHVHYSPLEAMVVGAPVLYFKGALLDRLAQGAELPGQCVDADDMRTKAERLLSGDRQLADAIRSTQNGILDIFSITVARRQWSAALKGDPTDAPAAAL